MRVCWQVCSPEEGSETSQKPVRNQSETRGVSHSQTVPPIQSFLFFFYLLAVSCLFLWYIYTYTINIPAYSGKLLQMFRCSVLQLQADHIALATLHVSNQVIWPRKHRGQNIPVYESGYTRWEKQTASHTRRLLLRRERWNRRKVEAARSSDSDSSSSSATSSSSAD